MLEAVMNAHALSYPSLQRRLIAKRRARALFLPRTTQHVSRVSLAREVTRAAIALAGITAWATAVFLLAA
jgi:hypothetical protein